MITRTPFLFLIFIFSTDIALAQGYVPLAPLPGVTTTGTSLAEYIGAVFNIGIGLAAVLAVLMIVIGGVQYIGGAASPSARSDAKNKITNAILGLLLALGSWLIVYTINPEIIGGSFRITPVTFPTPAPVSSPLPVTPISPEVPQEPTPTTPITTFITNPITSPAPALPAPPPPSTATIPGPPPLVLSDPSNDFLIAKDCLNYPANGKCSRADFDSNGKINGSDFSLFLESFKYDLNGDSLIEFAVTPPITYCSFKTGSIPRPFCVDVDDGGEGDGIDDRFNVPCDQINTGGVPLFEMSCATDAYSNMVFSIDEFYDLKRILKKSLDTSSRVNLRQAYTMLFSCDEDEEGCYFDNNLPFRVITYATMVMHDSNRDGYADFTGGDPISDFNGDGEINAKDDDFTDFLNKNIFTTGESPFIPFEFTLGKMEAFLFDSAGFSDRQIIEYCIGKTPIMDCAMADVNSDFSVDSLDLTTFDNNSPQYDINSDGVVNTFAP